QASLSYRDAADQYSQEAIERFNIVPSSQVATLSLSYTQSLLRNLGLSINRTAIEQASISRRISEHQLRATMLRVVEETIRAYWNMVGAEQSLEVARQSLDLARDFLDQTRVKVEVGTLPPIEVTTAEAEVASREEAVILAETELERTRDVLRQLIRVPDGSPDWLRPIEPLDKPGFSPREVRVETAIATALERRPDIAEVDLRLRNAELSARYQRNQTRPDLSVTGSYSATGNSFDYLPQTVTQQVFDPGPDGIPGTPDDVGFVNQQVVQFFPFQQGSSEAFREIPDLDNTFWSVRLDLTIPIRNRRARAQFARARLAVEQARLNAEAARLAARVEVRDAVRNLQAAARRVDSARANLVLQRRKLEAEQKRYENGLSTAFQVLEFQNDLREAEQREIQAIIDYNNAEVALERVQATLLDEIVGDDGR
ncbi:MAG: TolC family protein, partial [Acidobacteria bacterium]